MCPVFNVFMHSALLRNQLPRCGQIKLLIDLYGQLQSVKGTYSFGRLLAEMSRGHWCNLKALL